MEEDSKWNTRQCCSMNNNQDYYGRQNYPYQTPIVSSQTTTTTTPTTTTAVTTNNNNNNMMGSSTVLDNPMYTQGFLREQIGKLVRVQFLIGTNSLQDRTGILTQVGNSYIVLRSLETGTDIFCDIYSIKFVTIANQQITMYGGFPV